MSHLRMISGRVDGYTYQDPVTHQYGPTRAAAMDEQLQALMEEEAAKGYHLQTQSQSSYQTLHDPPHHMVHILLHFEEVQPRFSTPLRAETLSATSQSGESILGREAVAGQGKGRDR
jgi:hypothetical protein